MLLQSMFDEVVTISNFGGFHYSLGSFSGWEGFAVAKFVQDLNNEASSVDYFVDIGCYPQLQYSFFVDISVVVGYPVAVGCFGSGCYFVGVDVGFGFFVSVVGDFHFELVRFAECLIGL